VAHITVGERVAMQGADVLEVLDVGPPMRRRKATIAMTDALRR
jgi:hypothetical protein